MVTWSQSKMADQDWDGLLSFLPGANIFQSSLWARHKADFGWRPIRAFAGPADAPVAAIQALAKDFPGGARLLWSRGGPIGDARIWNESLRSTVCRASGAMIAYGRICSYQELRRENEADLEASGWVRPQRPLDRNRTYVLDLAPEPETIKNSLSSNWRHNLKRGEARAPAVDWSDADPQEMERLYREMESLKGLAPQHRADELSSLIKALGPKLILKRCAVDGRTVALRACALFAGSAVDLLAAATAEARKVYASYALLWALILESRRRGARTYDLGGADPDAARGVADFKSGVGAKATETIGEWDFGRPRLLRRPAGELIAWKLGKIA